ncbi:MAG: YjgN family protein [Pseudomonadota bacterium]
MEDAGNIRTLTSAGANFTSLRFTGNTNEYFKIWIVNIALTLVTLGIYSAWATVRKNRYFYGNTSLNDARFDYHAEPRAILVGRVIATFFLALYVFSEYIHFYAPLVVILIIFALTPWLVVRSKSFKLRNTSLNNVRFGFNPDYNGAFKAYYGGALITVVTLGFGAPIALRWRNQFLVNNSRFGKSAFALDVPLEEFYSIAFRAFGLSILAYIAMFLSVFAIGAMVDTAIADQQLAATVITYITLAMLLLFYGAILVYTQVRYRNLIADHTTLDGHRLRSDWSAAAMAGLYLTNLFAIALTFGLATPWAQIRLAKYRAENTLVAADFAWEDFAVAEGEAGSAVGEALGDAFDVGVDIGF